MELTKMIESLQTTLGETLPTLVGAIAILVVGWFIAILIRTGIQKSLGFLKLNSRLSSSTGTTVNLESGIARAVYYVILLLVLMAFFNALEMETVSGPLQELVGQVFAFAPKLVAGGVLLLVAWVLATIVRTIVTRGLRGTTLDKKLSDEAEPGQLSQSVGNVLYWLIILLFLPAILGALELHGLLAPVQGMVNQILAMLPNIMAAGILALVGWFVAKIVRDLVSNLLSAAGADRLGERVGLQGTLTLSRLISLVVYIFILIPALIAALQALKIEALTTPATQMLNSVMLAIPNIFAAAFILAIAYFVSGLVANLLSSLLGGMGFDGLPAKLGLGDVAQGDTTPSKIVGKIIIFFIMLFATVEAANRLGFGQLSDLVSMFIQFGGQVLLGMGIIAVGFWLSNLAYKALIGLQGQGFAPLANIIRFAILGLVLAMGLRAMGIADDIVNLAFGLTLGALAIAVALSFGLGGREAAGRQMEHWLSRLRGEK
ncbi:MAG: mechanosensitive ion channel [Nitrospirae bacterium]|nr:mechanosensitive ion channel [Nitrospirota bacterium]